MKKIYFILSAILLVISSSCRDFNEDNFSEFEDWTRPQNVAKYEYSITSDDITTIVNSLNAKKTKNDSLIANTLKKEKAFSNVAKAGELVPIILNKKFLAGDKASSALVTLPVLNETTATIDTVVNQFIFTGFAESLWVFDPTISVSMEKSDYQKIVDYVIANFDANLGLVHRNKNQEYYYGSNAYFGNISWREKDHSIDLSFPLGGTDEEKEEYYFSRTKEALAILLATKYPDAKVTVSGIQQEALVSFIAYTTLNTTYTYKFKCVSSNAAALKDRWEFVEIVK